MLTALLIAGSIALPAPAPVSMDYLATAGSQVWVPAGNTGKVFVYEGGKFREIAGFATTKGRGDRLMGPSSANAGEGVVYVGNRGDSSVCAFDVKSLEKKACATVSSSPDGTFYVAPTHEVWVTTPRDKSLRMFEGGSLKPSGTMQLDGEPEGYAVDASRGLVYTNLEDKDRTLVVDAKARKVVATFEPGCGEKGPRGLAVDPGRGLLFVACTDGVVALDAHTGARKGRLETGVGVDNIDYLPARKLLYATAGKDAKLTIAQVADDGSFKTVKSAPVGQGCRVVVATPDGTAYAADSAGAKLWTLEP
jgi:DNA-binding beta-propeller fold protein YncE